MGLPGWGWLLLLPCLDPGADAVISFGGSDASCTRKWCCDISSYFFLICIHNKRKEKAKAKPERVLLETPLNKLKDIAI